MQHRLFSSVVAVALALFMGVSAAAQSGNNSRYYQFADTAAASVSSPASGRVRLFFDGTGFYWKNSAGVSTAVGGGGFTLTQYAIPMAATTTTLGDSKMIASGTNKGTWTLYDDTAGTGVSQIYVRDGAGQASSPQLVLGTNGAGVGLSIYARPSTAYVDFRDGNAGSYINLVANGLYGGSGGWVLEDSSNALVLSSGSKITWQSAANYYSGSPDIGLARSAAGILAVTDGSTGQGGIGIADSATNTVSDALILRHATSGTAAASFGTGLLFQGEDGAGNMQDMASIDAVYTDATNGSEDTEIWLNTFAAGAEVTAMVFSQDRIRASTLTLDAVDGSTGVLYLATGGTSRWLVQSAPTGGGLLPFADNTYNFGHPTLKIKDAYLGTSIQGTRTQAISDNAAAATFVTVAVPTSNTAVGGRIFYTITAIDAGTASQIKTGSYSFGLNNIGGTLTGAGTDVLEHSQLSVGTLAPTFSVNISGTNAQFQLVLDTSLDAAAETLKIEYRVQIDSGTATVTPAT